MLTSTTCEGAVEALDEVDSIHVHLEIYRAEMPAICALQTLTAWLLRPHAKRININCLRGAWSSLSMTEFT